MVKLRDQLIALQAGSGQRTYQKDEVIWDAGEPAATCLFLLAGKVVIETAPSKDGLRLEIATRTAGDLIGEMSLFTKVRSARVLATREVRAAEYKHTDIIEHAKLTPDFALALLALSYDRAYQLIPRS